MSQEISIVLSLLTAQAGEKLDEFLGHAGHGLKELAETALEAYISFEGMKKLFEMTEEAIKLEEAIGRLHERTGLSVQMLGALKEEASANGVQFDELSTSVGKFSQMIYEAVTQGGKPADAFERLKVSLLDSEGALRSTDDVLADVAQRFKEMPAGPQKAAMAVDLFGRAGRQLIPVLNEGADGIARMKEEGSPITDESVNSAMEFEKGLREVHEQIEKIFLQVANNLLPWLKQTAEELKHLSSNAEHTSYVVEGLTDFFKGLITVCIVVGAVFNTLGKAIGVIVAEWVDVFTEGWEIIKTIADNIKAIAMDIIHIQEDMIGVLIAAGQAAAYASVGKFGDAKEVVKSAVDDMKEDFTSFQSHTGLVLDKVVEKFQKVMKDVGEMDGNLLADIVMQWEEVGKTLGNLWAKPERKPEAEPKPKDKFFPGATAEQIKLSAQSNALKADEFKLNEKIIEQNPFLTDIDKARQLIEIMEQYRKLLTGELATAQKNVDNAKTTNDKVAAEKELLKVKQEIAGLDISETQQALKLEGFATSFRLIMVQIGNEWHGWAQGLATSFKTVWDTAASSISQGVTQSIMGAKTISQAMFDVGRAIEEGIIQSIVQMAVQWVMTHVIMRGAMALTHAIGVALGWSAAAQSTAQEASKAPALATNAATASVSSYGASAIVGAALAIAAIGAIIAAASFRESGGPVSAGSPYIVGERRPELFVPNQSGFILPRVPSAASFAQSREQAVPGQGETPQVHMHIVDSVESAHRRARQDPDMEHWVVDVVNRNSYRISKRA